jgi:hypothetical protein
MVNYLFAVINAVNDQIAELDQAIAASILLACSDCATRRPEQQVPNRHIDCKKENG